MNKLYFLLFLVLPYSISAKPLLLNTSLIEFEKAYKAFEPQADKVKVQHSSRDYGNTVVHTTTYTPFSHELSKYVDAYRTLQKKLQRSSIVKGAIIGSGLAGMAKIAEYKSCVSHHKTLGKEVYLLCALLSVGAVAQENLSMDELPYVDIDTMKKSQNLFDVMNWPTIERAVYASGTAAMSYLFTYLALTAIMKK